MVWKDVLQAQQQRTSRAERWKKKNFQKPSLPGNKTEWGQIKLMWGGSLISSWKWMIYTYQIVEKWDGSKGDIDIAH